MVYFGYELKTIIYSLGPQRRDMALHMEVGHGAGNGVAKHSKKYFMATFLRRVWVERQQN